MKNKSWTTQELNLLKREYKNLPMYKLRELFPEKSSSSIRSQAYRLGESSSNLGERISMSKTRPSVMDTFFENVNDINGSFIAGLIASDGNIYFDKKNPRISIKLKVDDRDYLEDIKKFMGVPGELYLVKRGEGYILGRKINIKDQVMLNVFSVKTAVRHLEENYNITPNKTLTLMPPNITDLRAKISYTVGYIDGDGSIYTSSGVVKGKRYYYNKLSIYGQLPIIQWMQNEVFGVLNPQTKNIKIKKNSDSGLYSITFSESSLTSYLHEVDKLNLPKMERKWSILSREEKTNTRKANKHGQVSIAKNKLLEILNEYPYQIKTDLPTTDAYLPEKKIAFTINDGSIPELNKKYENYKRKKALEEKGIRNIQFWAHSLTENPKLITSMIRNYLGHITQKIHARKCTLKEIPSKQYREFLKENHIEGEKNSGIRLGLYHQGQLVSVMGFTNYKNHYELDRFCSQKEKLILGGFSRLFAHRPKDKDIISYSFNSYSEGNVYKVNNFNFIRENKNTLYYHHEGKLKNRNNFMKYKLAERLGIQNVNEYKEMDLAEKIGAYQVFDAGTKTWLYKNCFI
jgi:hypothetical protein